MLFGNRVIKEILVILESLDRKALQALKELRVILVIKDLKVFQVKKEILVHKESKVTLDLRAIREILAQLVKQVLSAPLGYKGLKVIQVQLEQMELQDLKVTRVTLEYLVLMEQTVQM